MKVVISLFDTRNSSSKIYSLQWKEENEKKNVRRINNRTFRDNEEENGKEQPRRRSTSVFH